MGAQHIGFAPMPAVALILSRFDRAQLGSFVEIAIELMDVADGDLNIEPNGDELDGTGSGEEDPWMESFAYRANDYGPGSPEDREEDDPSGGSVDDEGEPENGI